MSLPREIGIQTWSLVTVGIRKNAPWADAAPRGMSYTNMHFSYGTAKRRGKNLYRDIRGKLEAKMVQP